MASPEPLYRSTIALLTVCFYPSISRYPQVWTSKISALPILNRNLSEPPGSGGVMDVNMDMTTAHCVQKFRQTTLVLQTRALQ
jgi:hypothetical protein